MQRQNNTPNACKTQRQNDTLNAHKTQRRAKKRQQQPQAMPQQPADRATEPKPMIAVSSDAEKGIAAAAFTFD